MAMTTTAETIIGLMSGSSVDGLDLVAVDFLDPSDHSNFIITACETTPYPDLWTKKLHNAFFLSTQQLEQLDLEYGALLGQMTHDFITRHNIKPLLIASHGHTIFHKPKEHYTLQIGDGQNIADSCGCMVINDFRSEDVAKGGQGAPLVPIGDKYLFAQYPICLNIGGIANISYDHDDKRIAFDICIANQALNHLSKKIGLPYDDKGNIARQGNIDRALLNKLNDNIFFTLTHPKSLGREYFDNNILPLLEHSKASIADLLSTITEHIAIQIATTLRRAPRGQVLTTGGGAFNCYLLERIQHHSEHELVVPNNDIINFKEALIFAYLGFLRHHGYTNVLSSVTGATSDSCSGKIWHPSC